MKIIELVSKPYEIKCQSTPPEFFGYTDGDYGWVNFVPGEIYLAAQKASEGIFIFNKNTGVSFGCASGIKHHFTIQYPCSNWITEVNQFNNNQKGSIKIELSHT